MIAKLLAAPVHGLIWIAREISAALDQEGRAEEARLMQSLAALHLQLERAEISESQFDAEEAALLDRLDSLRHRSRSRRID